MVPGNPLVSSSEQLVGTMMVQIATYWATTAGPASTSATFGDRPMLRIGSRALCTACDACLKLTTKVGCALFPTAPDVPAHQ